jgi:hypothetical protein
VLRKTIGLKKKNKKEVTEDWRKLYTKNLRNFHSSPNIITEIKSRSLRRTAHVGNIEIVISEGKRPFERSRLRRKGYVKMGVKRTGHERMD